MPGCLRVLRDYLPPKIVVLDILYWKEGNNDQNGSPVGKLQQRTIDRYGHLMNLNLHKGQKFQLEGDLAPDRERSTKNRHTAYQLVFPSPASSVTFGAVDNVVTGNGDYVDFVHSFHPWDQPSGAMNCCGQGPDNRTESTF